MTELDPSDTPASDPGDAFEEACWGLLRRRYRPEQLVYLPAEMGGDCGIEGYSTDGIAYQCYADRDSLTMRHRTDKQKSKLYTDTSKLKKYAAKLRPILDGTVIENYFLLVPDYHATELVSYANERAKAVRNFGLDFIGSSFSIRIKTQHDYPEELRAALADGAAKALIPRPQVRGEHIELFSTDKPDLVKVLDHKLEVLRLDTSDIDLRGLRNQFIRAFLAKEEIMKSLEQWPETWQAVEQRRILSEERLEIECELGLGMPAATLKELMRSYEADLSNSVASVRNADAQRLAIGQVGDWLMRCPLRFRRGAA